MHFGATAAMHIIIGLSVLTIILSKHTMGIIDSFFKYPHCVRNCVPMEN